MLSGKPFQAAPAVLRRYVLFQIPGSVLVAALAFALHRWGVLPAWGAVVTWLVWTAKDIVLYPWLRAAYVVDPRLPAERLVGRRGVATQPIAPSGYVRLGGELWRADADGGVEIAAGVVVEVVAADRMTLVVREEPHDRLPLEAPPI